MDLLLKIDIKKLEPPVSYGHKIMLIGSCFTEHIGNALTDLKFSVLQNPNGILFGADAVCKSLASYLENKRYSEDDLFQLNEVWNSWNHHSRFSNIDKSSCLQQINNSQQQAHDFLKNADWLIITLGSSFSYKLTSNANAAAQSLNYAVANCHRAPANWFKKELMAIDETIEMLENCLKQVKRFNPRLKFIFTVSPVRHIRDGVVENNRSKARLIEAVHSVISKEQNAYYFPAYELVIDVLRDYRFYDVDLVHPNYAATEFVLEKFVEHCIDENSGKLIEDIRKVVIARKHKAFQPETKSHQQFLVTHFEKAKALQEKYPFLDFREELKYFSNNGISSGA